MKLRKIRGVYHVVVAGRGGKNRAISTGERDRGRAKKVVDESGVESLQRAARAGRLTREAIGHITSGARLTMDKVVESFEKWMVVCGRSPKTVTNTIQMVTCWLRDMKIGGLHPNLVTVEHVSKWVNDPQAKLKASSRAIRLSCVRTLFAFMAANGWVISDVAQLVTVDYSILSHKEKESQKRVPFTPDELDNLTEYLDNNNELFWLFAVTASHEAGYRLGDICQLEWSCFVEEPGAIVVWTDKRNKRVVHKMSKELSDLVAKIPAVDSVYLFPEQRTMVIDPKKRGILSVQFSRILEKVSISGKSFHCLRHTFATNHAKKESKLDLAKRLAEALDKKEIAKLLGHSDTRTTEGYIHE